MMPVQIWQVHSRGDLEPQRFNLLQNFAPLVRGRFGQLAPALRAVSDCVYVYFYFSLGGGGGNWLSEV